MLSFENLMFVPFNLMILRDRLKKKKSQDKKDFCAGRWKEREIEETLDVYLYGIRNIHIVMTIVRGDLLLFSAKSTITDACCMV